MHECALIVDDLRENVVEFGLERLAVDDVFKFVKDVTRLLTWRDYFLRLELLNDFLALGELFWVHVSELSCLSFDLTLIIH